MCLAALCSTPPHWNRPNRRKPKIIIVSTSATHTHRHTQHHHFPFACASPGRYTNTTIVSGDFVRIKLSETNESKENGVKMRDAKNRFSIVSNGKVCTAKTFVFSSCPWNPCANVILLYRHRIDLSFSGIFGGAVRTYAQRPDDVFIFHRLLSFAVRSHSCRRNSSLA